MSGVPVRRSYGSTTQQSGRAGTQLPLHFSRDGKRQLALHRAESSTAWPYWYNSMQQAAAELGQAVLVHHPHYTSARPHRAGPSRACRYAAHTTLPVATRPHRAGQQASAGAAQS